MESCADAPPPLRRCRPRHRSPAHGKSDREWGLWVVGGAELEHGTACAAAQGLKAAALGSSTAGEQSAERALRRPLLQRDPCGTAPCLNGGTCVPNSGNGNGYRCVCAAGFVGNNCDKAKCTDSTCQNGGTCKNSAAGPVCTCLEGYSGANCEIEWVG